MKAALDGVPAPPNAARWINDAAADLDLVKLRPLIDAIRKREDESGSGGACLYQVREQTAVYRVA